MDIVEAPHRAHEIALKAGGDTAKDLAWALRTIANDIERGQISIGASGGPSCGWTHEYRHYPDVTHESYFAAVDAWLARDRENTAALTPPLPLVGG